MSGNYILSQAHILLTDDKRYLISFVDEDSKELYFSIYYCKFIIILKQYYYNFK